MKRIILLMWSMLLTFSLTACNKENTYRDFPEIPTEESDGNKTDNNQNDEDMTKETFSLKVKFDNHELTATLLNNATTRAFVNKLPITLPMLDLYNREMCYRFPEALPTDNVNICGYEVGEIVYYPPMHSFVIMYAQNGEHFSMQKLGTINSDVAVLNGIGNIDITFERSY